MITATTILSIIELSLNLIDQVIATNIKNKIITLRTDYETELSKPYGDIDDAKLFDIELCLGDVVSLYSAAAKSATPTSKPVST